MQNRFIDTIKQLPFIRLIIPFILGIVVQLKCHFETSIIQYSLVGLFFILIISFIISRNNRFRFRFFPGFIIQLLLFISGVILLKVNTPESFPFYGKKIIAEAILKEEIQEKPNSFKADIKIGMIYFAGELKTGSIDIIAYFEKTPLSEQLKYGDRILFVGKVNEVKTQGNPNEFDYKRFLINRGITGQTFIQSNRFKVIDTQNGNKLFETAYKFRTKLASVYKNNRIGGREFAVLKALTLGDQSEIDTETKQSYSYSGATHILSVSGLHVGIIYVLFNFFLRFLGRLKTKKFNYGVWLKVIILLIILWGFALLTGLSPSVKRASLMFSFVVIGHAGKRYVNIYNSIAASAFVLLIVNPYDITDIGFQLSYIAVISIVYYQPLIKRLFVIKNKLLYYFWSLTAVSIAAQIGTFPITLYYFNMFPNYFILTNILVIPLSTGILYLAVLMFIFSFSPILTKYIGLSLKYIVGLLNESIHFVEDIPFSYTNNISFKGPDIVFAYLFILCISLFLSYKYYHYLKYSLFILLFWISFSTLCKIDQIRKKEIIVFNISGETAVNFIGKKNYLIADSTILQKNKLKYGALPYWIKIGKPDFVFIKTDSLYCENDEISMIKNRIRFGGRTIVIINNEKQIEYDTKNPLEVDIVIVSKNIDVDMYDITRLYDTKQVIFDSSNNYNSSKNGIKECKELSLQCFSVIEKGAFHLIFR